jgi:hypothetical protein
MPIRKEAVADFGEPSNIQESIRPYPSSSEGVRWCFKGDRLIFEPLRLQGTIEQYLPKDKHKGTVDMTGVKTEEAELSPADKERQELLDNKPPLSECLSLHDFETIASKVRRGWRPNQYETIGLRCYFHADNDTSCVGVLFVRS